ncbi:class I SAM-dependent methyltransferase [Gephyromycinifex aptenodytis]|uniref:class I SAM-dependent methyltransferase n=1 Tax=Gephyromycinifex aptenodytis TaxID=2716227 RepID=UPI001445FBC1|nr:class I SAM-dependent methyltransferase [Gephyromycinifex aptenodytis]
MLTVDFDRLGLRAGERLLDLGCGAGRHAFEAYRRGARVTAFDQDEKELAGVQEMFEAMAAAGEGEPGGAGTTRGDALHLPFSDGEFDRVIAAEILEHIPQDREAISELVRVLRPGGTMAVTVPRFWPERICWALSDEYHQVEGGHVRIYRADTLAGQLSQAGLDVTGRDHVHALHAPYWWLKCAVGVDNDDNPLVKGYHRMLVWDLMKKPALTRTAERLLDPVLGKSVVLYARKPA